MKLKTLKLCLGMAVATLTLSSCAHRIVGTWTVDRYESIKPQQESVVLSNIGTIEFNKNGSGEKNLDYSVMGIKQKDQLPFEWSWDDDQYISIESEGSRFSKTWIIIENKRKYQKWKSTDGTDNIQVIELKK